MSELEPPRNASTLEYYWKIARARAEVDAAQQLRFACYQDDLDIEVPDDGVRRDISSRDNLEGVEHVLVYRGLELVGTARLAPADATISRETGTYFGFELEREFNLGALRGLGSSLAEIARVCVARPYRRTDAVRRLYEGLYVRSCELGLGFWVGGVDCATNHEVDARIMETLVAERGLQSSRFHVAPLQPHAALGAAERQVPFYNAEERTRALAGDTSGLRLAPALAAFTRSLGAKVLGAAAPHPVFAARYVLPAFVVINEMPQATLRRFDQSLIVPPRLAAVAANDTPDPTPTTRRAS